MIRGIIFDLDGVLVDAEKWHFDALNGALALFGYTLSHEEHLKQYDGLTTIQKLEKLSRDKHLPRSLHPFLSEMKQKYTQEIISAECKPDPIKSHLLETLRAQGLLLGVASNCLRSTVELVLEKMRINPCFDCILSREDVDCAKPSPKIFSEAMRRLQLLPEETLILEDSSAGLEAARQSHAHVTAVRSTAEVSLDFIQSRLIKDETDPSAHILEIIIPMAGEGSRFREAGYTLPKPLISVHGKAMIDWVVENIRPRSTPAHFTFLCNQEHLERYALCEHLQRIAPGCSIVAVPKITQGAACTVLLAADSIGPQNELLLANSDQFVDYSIDEFLRNARSPQKDGLIMTFESSESKWSFAKLDPDGNVLEVAEKNPISRHATVGIYYFHSANTFFESAKEMIRKNIRTNNEFYVCPVYNEAILMGNKIGIHAIPTGKMHGLGTPEDLERFIKPLASIQPTV